VARQDMWPSKACSQAGHVDNINRVLGVLEGVCIICLGGMSPLSPCAISTDSLAKDRSWIDPAGIIAKPGRVCIQRLISLFLLFIDFSVLIEGNVGERIDKSVSEAMFPYDIVGLVI
jgi:hypothetical protein